MARQIPSSKKKTAKKAPGRPAKAPGEKLEQFSIRLPPKLKFGLELLARAQHRSLSQVVEWAIQVGLNSYEFRSESAYPTLGGLVDELWPMPEHLRMLHLGESARHLLTFEETVATDLVLTSVEWRQLWLIDDTATRKKKREDLEGRVGKIWPQILEVASSFANEGRSAADGMLEHLEEFIANGQKRA